LVQSLCGHDHRRLASTEPHNGRDSVIGLVQLEVADMIRMCGIMTKNWSVDVYKLVEDEKAKHRERKARRSSTAATTDNTAGPTGINAPNVDPTVDEQNLVSVVLRHPKHVEAAIHRHPDRSIDEDDSSVPKAGFLSFSSLSFYSSRHVDSRDKLVEYQRAHHHHHKSRRSSTNSTTTSTE